MGTYLWRCVWAFVLLLVVAVLVGAPLSVASGAETICSNPAVWLCVDFEDGTTGGLIQSPDNTWVNSGDKAAFGARSLKTTFAAIPSAAQHGGSGFGEWYRNTARAASYEYHFRWYNYFSSNWVWSSIETKDWMLAFRTGAERVYLSDPFAQGNRCARPEWDNVARCPNTGPANLQIMPKDRWVQVEVHLNHVTGRFREWRDGILVNDRTGINLGPATNGGLRYIMISGQWNCVTSPTSCLNDPARASQSRWVDNLVAIDGDVMIGATATGTSAPPTYTLAVSKAGSGTGTVSGLGISCGVDCAELVPGGTSVILTAAPGPGSTFTGWSGGGCSGTASCTTTVSANTTVTATFALPTYTLTVSKTGTGTGTVSGPGVSCGIDCAELVPGGTSVILTAAPGPGSTFTGWSGGGCSGTASCTTTVSANTTVTATFALPTYTLTVSKTGTGTGTVSGPGVSCGIDCAELVPGGTSVILTAAPGPGSTFTGWSGGGCSGTASCTTTVSANTTVTATFALPTYTLTVSKTGTGTGTVSGPGVSCGIDCAELVPGGTSVILTAAPGPGSTFTGWSGGGCSGTASCTTTVSANTTVTATFALPTYTLTVSKTGTGTGTVSGPGVSCGIDCAELVPGGTSVILTAAPGPGSTFTGWSGGGCSGTASCTTTVSANTTVTATFALPTYTLTVSKTGTGTGTVSGPGVSCGIDCAELVPGGTSVILTAAPGPGSTFTGWSGGGCSGTASCTTTVSANTTVTATFALPTYTLTVSKTGTGTGTVSGPGVSCGIDCAELVPGGTSVILTAAPGPGSTFTGWSGGGCSGTASCTTTVSANTTVTATFALPTYTLTVSKTGTGTGTVSGPGVSCGIDCAELVPGGTSVILTAAPGPGSTFTGWSGGGCSGTASCTTTVSANTTVTATFTLPTYTLTVSKAGSGTGTVSGLGISCGTDCSEPVVSGGVVSLAVAPASGSIFAGWSGACGGTGDCTVTVSTNTVVGATFDSTPSSSLVEIIVGAEPGSAPRVRGLTRDGVPTTTDFLAYASSFTGGLFVGLGSLGSPSSPLIVTGSGAGIPAEVRAFRLDGSSAGASVRPYGKSFSGGVRIAVCDVDGDGTDEIVTVPGSEYKPQVAIWALGSQSTSKVLTFNAGRPTVTTGLFVACADFDGDGASEIVVGNDQGAAPEVRVYRVTGTSRVALVASFLAYNSSFTGGVRVTTADVDGDGLADIITAPGVGGEPVVRAFKITGGTVTELTTFHAEDPGFTGGLFVAGGKRDELGGAVVMTSPGPGGSPHVRIFSVSPVVVIESATVVVGDPGVLRGVTLGASQ